MKKQLKKLSDLKENEYVYCLNNVEQKRISGDTDVYALINNKGKGMPFAEVFPSNNVTMVYDSKDIADYEPPVPVRPKGLLTFVASLEVISHINQLNKYMDHLEKELEEVKSKAFVPFKVKCVKVGIRGITENKEYSVLTDANNLYCIINNDWALDIYSSDFFTKID